MPQGPVPRAEWAEGGGFSVNAGVSPLGNDPGGGGRYFYS